MNIELSNKKVVILADGSFPQHARPLKVLREAGFIVCCDGSAAALVQFGLEPGIIIGDLDSLGADMASRYRDRLVPDTNQDTNDLTKSLLWCSSHGAESVDIIGATGKREDHTLGNISLLADYGRVITVNMHTDTGVLFPVYGACTFKTFPGQRVSLFSLDSGIEVTSEGLKYPLNRLQLGSWWTATLNSAVGDSVSLISAPARLIIYLGY